MTGRVVIGVKSLAQDLDLFELVEALKQPATGDIGPRPFPLAPEHPEFTALRELPTAQGFAAKAGRKLFSALKTSPSVSEQMTLAISDRKGIYISDQSMGAQGLPWETLCHDTDDKFLVLDSGVPVGRLVAKLEAEATGLYFYDPPFRVLAVLAAAGTSALEEWKALETGLRDADLESSVHVIGADLDVQQAVAASDLAADFEFLVSRDTVIRAAGEFRPHVAHFFCHGMAGAEPFLDLATKSSQLSGAERGGVRFHRADFRDLQSVVPSLWAVVLNCCSGAEATDSGQSLARRVVGQGVPAVFAMQEPVDRRDANLFCRHFYPAHLTTLKQALEQPAPHRVDWTRSLAEPRKRLLAAHAQDGSAADLKEWSLPVVYVHHQPFTLRGRVAAGLSPTEVADLMAELDKLERNREDLSDFQGFPPSALAALQEEIEKIEAQLLGDD